MLRLLAVFALLFPSAAMARDIVSEAGCNKQENVTLSINFNGMSESVKAVKGEFETRMGKIEEFAKKAGVKKISLQSQSYNINSNNYSGSGSSGYQYNGSASFQLSPADKAADLMELLTTNGIQSSLNVNMYKSGSCQ